RLVVRFSSSNALNSRAMKLSELAAQTGARCEPHDADVEVSAAAGLSDAGSGHITFLANPRYTPQVRTTRASAIYLSDNAVLDRNDIAVLRAKDPYLAFTRALILFHPKPAFEPFVHSAAVVDPSATIGQGSFIGAYAVIGRNVKIGERARIHPHAIVYDDVRIGSDCVIYSGVAIREQTHIGDRVILAGQAGVAGHNTIGDDAVITAKSATSHDVPPGKVISGIPGFDNRDWLRSTAAFRRLGEMQKTLRELEKKVAEIEKTDSQE